MPRLSWSCLFIFLLTFFVYSCTNTEYDMGRRAGVDKWVNGVNYASSGANEANLFGQAGTGLAKNPLTQQTESQLGSYDKTLGDLKLSAEPAKLDVYINEIVELRFRALGAGDVAVGNARLVVVLERAPGKLNNAQLIWPGNINGQSLIEDRTTTYVVQSTSDGYVTIRVHTGTAYHAKQPMYYINVWSANAKDPASVELNVRKPPQMGDPGLVEGNHSTVNDLTPPTAALGSSDAIEPMLTANDLTHQSVFVKYTKRVGVTFSSKPGGVGGPTVPTADATICWTLVGQGGVNDARVVGSDLGVLTGCGKTDASGVYNVDFYSGAAYKAKYFLNFFHAKAAPVSYEFDTAAMPKTLGEEGTRPGADLDGDGLNDDELKVEVPTSTVDPTTGKEVISPDKAQVLLEGLASKDAVLKDILDKNCYDSAKVFVCSLEKDGQGNWVLIKDGKPVLSDVDGDGLEEPVVIVIVKGADGNDYFGGYDTDGDGAADTPPDPCFTDPTGVGCSDDKPATHVVWCRQDAKSAWRERCGVSKIGIDDTLTLEVQIRTAGEPVGPFAGGIATNWEIIKSFEPTNNGAFDAKGGPKTKKTTSDNADGSSVTKFWTGTAHTATYYVKVSTASSKAVYLPISTIYMMGVPLSQGDKPSDSVLLPGGEAVTPPADMPKPQAGLGNVKIVAEGMNTFSSPVVKTLLLNIKVVSEDGTKPILNTQTYWKVTRGLSPNNNATLISNRALTNGKGLGSNSFYTGTAFESLYYVSVFHPNAAAPLIFTIKTDKYSGEGTGPVGDPSTPGDGTSTPCVSGTPGCSAGDYDTVDGESTYSAYPQGIGCTEADLQCEKGLGACKPVEKDKVPGCLLLTIEGDKNRVVNINSTERVKVRLVWLNGSERVPVDGNILWTLDKGDDADGILTGKRSSTDASGYATAIFRTGSLSNTKYRINAYFPNIHEAGKMVAHSVTLTTEYSALVDSGSAKKNIIRASAKASGTLEEALAKKGEQVGKIQYYLLSSDYHNCDPTFALQTAEKRLQSCQTKASSGDNRPVCDKDGTLEAATPIEVKTTGEAFLLYAVAESIAGGVPLGFGCSPGNWFPSIPKDEAEAAERYLDIEVELGAVPMEIYGVYHSQSLIDLGGLLSDGTPIGDKLTNLADEYVKYFGGNDNPGKKLVEYLKRYILFDKIGGTDADDCAKAFCKDITSLSASGNDCKDAVSGSYKACGSKCVCYTFYYYSQQSGLGKLVTPLLTSLLESMINKLIGKATGGIGLQSKLCSVFDNIQFVELTGKTKFEKAAIAGQDDKIKGYVDFTGVKVPVGGSADSGFTAVRGLWTDAYLANGVDQLKIENFNLNFNYGLFVYQMLSSFMPADKDGKFNLLGFIKCDDLFSKDINIPVIGNVGAAGLALLCNSFVGQAESKVFDLADSKFIALGITATGGGRFGQGTGACEPAVSPNVGCKAMEVSDGRWDGAGTMKGKSYDIGGVWTAHRTKLEDAPAYSYGGQSVEEFKAERSVCMRKLRNASAISNMTLDSSEACLLGSYDKAEARATNNACRDERCYSNPSIVVCEKDASGKGIFNSKYAQADKKAIILASNEACKALPTDAGCKANPEVINGGLGVTNTGCWANCSMSGCANNPTIFVCDSDGVKLGSSQLVAACGGPSASNCDGKTAEACKGKCDTAFCIMNSASGCKLTGEEPALIPDIIATWTVFNNGGVGYVVAGKVDNTAFSTDIKAGIIADTPTPMLTSATLRFEGPDSVKFVTGSDGKLGAAGASKWTKAANQKWVISLASTGCSKLEVSMKIYGDGRTISVAPDNLMSAFKPLVCEQWTDVVVKIKPGLSSATVEVSSISEPDGATGSFKLLRIDDVVVKGVCTPIEKPIEIPVLPID